MDKEKEMTCKWCQTEFFVPYEQSSDFIITEGICKSCTDKVFISNDTKTITEFLDRIDDPILVLQPDPRLVFTANRKACALFGKDLDRLEGFRGGDVFDCVNSFTELGCGKDANCEECKIKGAIVDTFSGNSFANIEKPLEVKKEERTIGYILQISTEKVGNFALVRIDKYNPA